MPTEKPRITITMPEDQLDQIKEFQFSNKMKNQTQAILHLVELGFAEIERQSKSSEPEKEKAPESAKANSKAGSEEQKTSSSVEKTTPEDTGRKLDVNEVINAFVAAGLVGPDEDLTDADLRFFISIIDAIRSWFATKQEESR